MKNRFEERDVELNKTEKRVKFHTETWIYFDLEEQYNIFKVINELRVVHNFYNHNFNIRKILLENKVKNADKIDNRTKAINLSYKNSKELHKAMYLSS